jgi:glycosyltransferase involved in cell wall biosynthesis
VESGQTGLLVPPGDPETMAGAMRALLSDGGLRQRVISAGRERVLRDFDNRALVGGLAEIYREALADSAGRRIQNPPFPPFSKGKKSD